MCRWRTQQKLFAQAYCDCGAERAGECGALYCIVLYYMCVGGSCTMVKTDASVSDILCAKQLPKFHVSIIKESHKLNCVHSIVFKENTSEIILKGKSNFLCVT